jgi:hypothetical protein
MSTSLTDIKTKLIEKVKFQETPIPLVNSDYDIFVEDGAKRLYNDAGWLTWKDDYDSITNSITKELDLIEEEYILVSSQIEFYNQIKNFWTTLVSYTTDAISVTGARDIFKTINGNVTDLETRLSKLAFKFTHKKV